MNLCLFVLVAQAVISPVPKPRAVIAPPKVYTNTITADWNQPAGFNISSNLLIRRGDGTNQWWVGDVTQTVFSVVRTQRDSRDRRWNLTVSALSGGLSAESLPAYWPVPGPTNLVVELWAVQGVTRLKYLSLTNPAGNRFYRLWLQPTNSQWPVPVWINQSSTGLSGWANGQVLILPESPRPMLEMKGWMY